MYLKSIKAVGFKSFADKLDIELNQGITAVVGPNGSGKSNIVDAIRWVLGEQSNKALRADGSSDVIFNGSASREAHKRASVSLLFDNTDHYFNSEFEELEVKRTVYANGENEYYLNNVKVRLKDINDLFIDSGTSTFNIISQGNITDIVNSKPHERRAIFESAAGVLKYKKRKETAIKKLEATKENIKTIKLLIDELSVTVEPLKKQSEIAKKYLEIKDKLEQIEIALISYDINDLNIKYEDIKSEIDLINNKLTLFNNISYQTEIEKLKLENIKLDEEINKFNKNLIDLNEEISSLSSEKQMMIERSKYSVDKEKINSNLLKNKEDLLEIEKNINVLEIDINTLKDELNVKNNIYQKYLDAELAKKIKKSSLSSQINDYNKKILYYQNKKEIIENNILNEDKIPTSVRYILNNKRLSGIHNTIGNLIELPDEYETAILTSLGSSANFIVVDSFDNAKESINYLKNEKLGRATFFPLDTIKGRYIDKETLDLIKNHKSFIGIARDLIKFDKKYENIISNQLGNVIITKNLESLNEIGKQINYKYKIISLDGDVMYSGGSLSGGINKNNNLLTSKQELIKLEKEEKEASSVLKNLNFEFEKVQNEYEKELENEQKIYKEITILKENIEAKELSLNNMIILKKNKESEIKGSEDLINNKIDDEINLILEKFTEKTSEKIIIEKKLNNLKNKRIDVNNEINDIEKKYHEQNTEYNILVGKLKEYEVEKGKIEVKLDNLLIDLNDEYNMTYENAKDKYELDRSVFDAREEVKYYKKELMKFSNVNIGAINEYERLSKRYDFLINQEQDLSASSDELLSIISDMDEIMIEKFKTSFNQISKEFKEIFKSIFQGGRGEIILTNPDNILETGVDIIAEPPGKRINNTTQLSGGEKALTAICLLFSILNIRSIPFIVLDEAEAALDEKNVEMFGKYISKKKDASQFILITHKKKMMEYADTLYGITMQESGVSKIVSSKLED